MPTLELSTEAIVVEAPADISVVEITDSLVTVEAPSSPVTVEFGSSANLIAGTGLTGGGYLLGNVNISLDAASQASLALADTALQAADLSGYQPLNANLTGIAALTTSIFGRGLLELGSAIDLRTLLDVYAKAEVYTQAQVDAMIGGFAGTVHTHAIADVTGLQTALDGKLALTGGVLSGNLDVGSFLRLRAVDAFVYPINDNSGQLGGPTNRFANIYGTTIYGAFSGSGALLTSIPETAITDGALLARLASNETVTGNWGFMMDTIGDYMFWRNGTTGASGIGFRNDDGVKGYIAFDDNGAFGIYDAATSNKLFVDASGNLEADGNLTTGPVNTRGQFTKGTNGWQTNIGGAQHTDAAVANYRSYIGNDVYWDDVADNWVANRTTLGRKFMIDMGYHNNAMRVRYYDGVITAPWADSAWTDLLKITPTQALFVGAVLPVNTATQALGSSTQRWAYGYATTWYATDGTATVYTNYTGLFSDRASSYVRNTASGGAWYMDSELGTVIRDYNAGTPTNIISLLASGVVSNVHISPDADSTRSLGTAALRWLNVYAATFQVPAGNLSYLYDSNLITIKPNTSAGGWARGMTVVRQSDSIRVAGAGWLGSGEAITGYYIGFGSNWWSTESTFSLTANGDITSKGVLTLDRQISTTSYVSLKNQGVQFGYMGASVSSIGFWDSAGAWKLSLALSSGDLTAYGAVVPLNNGTQNLGAPAQRWQAYYGSTLDVTGAIVSGGTLSFLGEPITDFDSTLVNLQKEVGFFSAGFQATGYPTGANYWSGIEFKHNIGTDYRTQIATGTTDGTFAIRYKINGVWTSWHNIWQSGLSNLPRANNSFTLGSDTFRFASVHATDFYEGGVALSAKYAAAGGSYLPLTGGTLTDSLTLTGSLTGLWIGSRTTGATMGFYNPDGSLAIYCADPALTVATIGPTGNFSVAGTITEAGTLLSAKYLGLSGGTLTGDLDTGSNHVKIGLGMLSYDPASNFTFDGDAIPHYGLRWYSDSGTGGVTAGLSGYYGIRLFTGGINRTLIKSDGTFYHERAGAAGIHSMELAHMSAGDGDFSLDAWNGTGAATDSEAVSIGLGYQNAAVSKISFYRGGAANADSIRLNINGTERAIFGADTTVVGSFYTENLYTSGAGNALWITSRGGSGTTWAFYNPSGTELRLYDSSAGLDRMYFHSNRLEILGEGYTTNPTGFTLGRYNSTTGYLQIPGGSSGAIDIWDNNSSFIARFQASVIAFSKGVLLTSEYLSHNFTTSADTIRSVKWPNGAYFKVDTATQIGTIKIKMPLVDPNSMFNITIKGYDYTANGAFTLVVGGYQYASNFVNTSASLVGAAPFTSVRFARDASGYGYILLGTTSTQWEYPQVWVDDASTGYTGQTAGWETGWEITQVTSETGLTVYATENLTMSQDGVLTGDLWSGDRVRNAIQTSDSYLRLNQSAHFTGGVYTPGILRADSGFYINSGSTSMVNGGGGSMRVQTPSGYCEIGPQNSSWSHFQTDRGGFWMNTRLSVTGGVSDYNGGTERPYLKLASPTGYTSGGNVTFSTQTPSGGSDGDIWFVYT